MLLWLARSTLHGNLKDANGFVKLYDGPGFDPDTPAFLVPNSVPAINESRQKLGTAGRATC